MVCVFLKIFSTALHLAVINKNIKIFNLLVAHEKIDTDIRTSQHEHSALFYSLSNETNIENTSNGYANSPLENGNPFADTPIGDNSKDIIDFEFAKKLIEKGCQLNPVYSNTWDNLLILLAKRKCEVCYLIR